MSWQPVSPMLSRTSASESRVRITQGHQISISLAAWKLLGEPSYVSLLVDPDRSLLALKASDGNEPEVFRLTPNSKGGTSKRFSTVALNRVFGVGTQPQSYTPQLEEGLLVFPFASSAQDQAVRAEKVRGMLAGVGSNGR